MIYRLKNVECAALLVTEQTTAGDLLAFGVSYADPAQSGGINVMTHQALGTCLIFPGQYLVKVTSPIFGAGMNFEVVDAATFASKYETL